MILADRGFTIEDSAKLYCAEVKVPPFTRGKKQFSRVLHTDINVTEF